MKPIVLVLLSFVFSLPFLHAQNLLAVENSYALKREIYQEGDLFRFKSTGNKRWFEGIIEKVYDSSVVLIKEIVVIDGDQERRQVLRDQVPFREISFVSYNGRSKFNTFKKVYGISAIGGGVLLLGTGLINVLTTPKDEGGTLDEGSMYIAGGLGVSGLILLLTAKNKHRIGKRWKLRAMPPLSPSLSFSSPAPESNVVYPTQ